MSDPGDWRNLESDWQSSPPDPAFTAKVRASLTWRIWLSRAWFASEILFSLLLVLNFVQKIAVAQYAGAAALALIGGVCAAGFWWARRARLSGDMESLRGMVDLGFSRARRTLRLVLGSYPVLLILLVSVLMRAPYDLLPAHLVWLGISIAVAVAIHVSTRTRLRRFAAMRRTLFGGKP